MTLQLRELSADAYAEHVLPLTHELWGYGRTLEAYVARAAQLAATAYGNRCYKTLALVEERQVLASFKRYERSAAIGSENLSAIGIGAVFTDPEFRGRGYASAMLASALDRERSAGTDFAFLFSDIHPQFYKDLGFIELPSRTISVRADTLEWQRLSVDSISPRDWSGIRTCFNAMASRRPWALARSAYFWTWLRTLLATENEQGMRVDLVVRRARGVDAYVLGRRAPRQDAYVVDECGFASERARGYVPALLRYAAGDLRRIAGWLPPQPVRGLLPRGSVRRRNDAVLMAMPITEAGTRFVELAGRSGSADPLWSTDHI